MIDSFADILRRLGTSTFIWRKWAT